MLALLRLLTEGFYRSSPRPLTPWLLCCLNSETRPPCFLKSNIWVESKALVHGHQALLVNGHSPLPYGVSFLGKDLSHHQHTLKRVPVNMGHSPSTSSLAPKTSEPSRYPPLESPGRAEMTRVEVHQHSARGTRRSPKHRWAL